MFSLNVETVSLGYTYITTTTSMAKIHVLISKREEENYNYKYIYHLNVADPKGRLSGRTGLLMGDLSASEHHSSCCEAIF